MVSIQDQTNASEVFAVVQQLSSQIDEGCIREIADKAKGLDIKDKQLIVDLLSIALEKNHHILRKADCLLRLLTCIASSTNTIAQNRIIKHERVTSEEGHTPGVYKVLGDPPLHVKVVKPATKKTNQTISEDLINWIHLSHANILPVYGVFLEGEGGPVSLVSPQITRGNILGHTKLLPQTARIPLICDVIEGLCYLHSLNLVHGALNPQNVLISNDGRAMITGLDKSEQDPETISVRYSAPEMLEDDALPTTASDIWSLGCLVYEVLSGKIPFYQTRQEGKVGRDIAIGKKPIRPIPENGVEEIDDEIWLSVSGCWEYEAKDRPSYWQVQKAFSRMIIQDNRPAKKLTAQLTEGFPLNIGEARSIVMRIADSNLSMPPPTEVPEHLQKPVSELADSIAKAEAVAIAAKKLSHDDTQVLIDVLDLIIKENPTILGFSNPVVVLLQKVMMSTHIFPQRYKINRILYDSTPIVEGDLGKVYKGRDLDICLSMSARPGDISFILKFFGPWACSSHPNLFPLYGVFHEDVNQLTRFGLVSPYMKNGLLRDYAPKLPQKDRVLLILDVINALVYLKGITMTPYILRGDRFLISDEGRALFDVGFVPSDILRSPWMTTGADQLYALRFDAPERTQGNDPGLAGIVWSLGCLVYEVLSRRLPYHQYTKETEIRSALSRRECPKRPNAADNDIDEISDQLWEVIVGCCLGDPVDRLTLSDLEKLFVDMELQDNRPRGISLPGAEALTLRSAPDINWNALERILGQIHVERLRVPLSKLIQNRTKDAAAAAMRLGSEDLRTLVDFLDLALKDHLTLTDERNRVLALLSRITTLSHIFPHRYELQGIKYHSSPVAEGGYGTVHRGVSNADICVKVMTKVDSTALMGFVKELILWAHASNPNVLPFYGVFLDESRRICLVSPFMNKGNLHDYGPRLPQKDRIPLLYDVIKGLVYLHGLGVVHTDLKGENVLISDSGHALITDFGASHVITATAKGGITTASVASTLRFTAPEMILNRYSRPTQEYDIWSFGCLCYEVLSRKLPYFEYMLEGQIYAALARQQLPKRPGTSGDSADDEEDWDEFDEQDWDEIDDSGWNLITKCCTPDPGDRPKASRIQELIVDLKIWDTRPEAKDTSGAHVLTSLRQNWDVNLNRAGELLDQLLVWLLARRTLCYRMEDVITAVKNLDFEMDDARALLRFWDLVLGDHLLTSEENTQALALLSALINLFRRFPPSHAIPLSIQFDQESIGIGSFGTLYRGTGLKICVKLLRTANLDSGLHAQWYKAPTPSVYSTHPNVLPLYGISMRKGALLLISPFMENGNLRDYALLHPPKLRALLICDAIEGLMYLHGLGVIHGNLKGENILISDEGRGVVADFKPYHINVAAPEQGPTGPYITSTLRFTAPELVKFSGMLPTTKSDIWSIGCLAYMVLSQKIPFHQYSEDAEIRSALSRGELPMRPVSSDNGTKDIDDQSWDLIAKCCAPNPDDRPPLSDIQKSLVEMSIQDNRPSARPFPGAEILKYRLTQYGVDVARAGDSMARIISTLPPISRDGEEGGELQEDVK